MNGRVVAIADYRGTPRLRSAVEAFFSDKQLSANSRRAYSAGALGRDRDPGLGPARRSNWTPSRSWWSSKDSGVRRSPPLGTPGSPPSSRSFSTATATNWIDHNPMTLVESAAGTPRPDQSHPLPRPGEHSGQDGTSDLREKTLWRMLYETAARAGEILALNVEDLDLPRKRAVIIGKGGHKEYVF